MTEPGFADARTLLADVAEIIRPPQRITVPEAAERDVFLDVPGGYQGPWSNDLPWYMVDPAECLTSRRFEAVIFVGPAQSAKTQALVDNWIAHSAICDPADMMVLQPTQEGARDYSRRRIDRLIDATPKLRARRPTGHADNTHDKTFTSGMLLSLGFPTKNQLAGKAVGRMALTDYDRMPEDINSEGSAFDLARKRTTTFLSRGMTVAESSPSRPIRDPKWRPRTAHEAPPTTGILGLYNTGDRRRLYARCPHCGEWFMPPPGPEAVSIPDEGGIDERAEAAALICRANGCLIGQEHEHAVKRGGRWLSEGQTIHGDGEISGHGIKSRRASFWMPGWFAAFQPWRSIVANYLMALDTYEHSGEEESLKSVINVDMASPYIHQAQLADLRDGEFLLQRAESHERYTVPEGVRTLIAAVDVQNNRFEVMVWGFGVGGERWIIDRYPIPKVEPAARIEDWDALTEKVVKSTYRLPDTELQVHRVGVDSGGAAGATERAYEWWRSLREGGLARRVRLVKGHRMADRRFKETYPDASGNVGRKGASRGDVPVLMLNSDLLKDAVHSTLTRETAGPGYIHIPDWLSERYADELMSEVRTERGWKPIGGRRNESFDLAYYALGVWLWLGGDRIEWEKPPAWARPMSENSNVMSSDERREMKRRALAPSRRSRVRFRFNQ